MAAKKKAVKKTVKKVVKKVAKKKATKKKKQSFSIREVFEISIRIIP